MIKTLALTLVCASILVCAGVAQAQSPGATGAMSSDPAASGGKHMMKKRHSMSRRPVAETTNAPAARPADGTPGIHTQSGSVAPTTPDPMQIKNARDGTPMKITKGGAGAASASK